MTRSAGIREASGQAKAFEIAPNSGGATVLLRRLEDVSRSGKGWRARCPACGGRSQKLSVTEVDGRVLVHCFACGDANAILAALGLTWIDLHPPRFWPESLDQRRARRRVMREAGWESALTVLALEAEVLRIAANELARWSVLTPDDDTRLTLAMHRINGAANVLIEGNRWRPTL